jgi:DNA-binding NarL/FixJ family response regulator
MVPDERPARSAALSAVPYPRAEQFSALVVDDQPLLRDAIAARLRTMGAGSVYEAASVLEARVGAYTHGPCDLAILGLGLPDGSGLDLVTELRSAGWNRLVALASANDPYAVRATFRAGAQAYLLKSASAATFVEGVERVLAGGVYADPTVAPHLGAADQLPGALSDREAEVLQLVADGRSDKQIGAALSVSPLLVRTHLARIGRKLGTVDRAKMVAVSIRAGVIR